MQRGTPREHGRHGRFMAALAGAALAACLVACSPTGAGESAPTPAANPTAPSPAPTSTLDVPVTSAQLGEVAPTVTPTGLRVADLGVDMPVTPVGLAGDGQMELPTDPAVAGWYRFGPDAASTAGNIVLAAHVDYPGWGIGPLARLRDASPGAAVTLTADDGSAREFVIESVTYYEKAELPLAELFSRSGRPALVIITCGGPFDASVGHYRDNVVAIATPR